MKQMKGTRAQILIIDAPIVESKYARSLLVCPRKIKEHPGRIV